MKNKILVQGFIILLGIFTLAFAQKKDEKAINAVFESYKKTILAKEGAKALSLLDSRTKNYYGEMLELSLHADSLSLQKLNLLDKLMVLTLRHRVPKSTLLKFDQETLLIYAIEKGMIGEEGVEKLSLGQIRFEDNKASADVLVDKVASPSAFDFYKEEGLWKLDLTSIFEIANASFEYIMEGDWESEEAFLFYLLEEVNGKTPSKDIWKAIDTK